MSSPLASRRRPFGRSAPRITEEEVLGQLRKSLDALVRTNKALEKISAILDESDLSPSSV